MPIRTSKYLSASIKEKSTLQGRVIPKFPINVVGRGAIQIDKKNGIYVFTQNPFYPLGDAPDDGLIYGRAYGEWVQTIGKDTFDTTIAGLNDDIAAKVGEAPVDGQVYGRRGSDASWVTVDMGMIGGIVPALDAKVDVAGDTMTGPLTLAADPASAMQAATKQYVDTKAPLPHVHPISDVISLQATLDAKEPAIAAGNPAYFWAGDKTWKQMLPPVVSWGDISGVPSIFPPDPEAIDDRVATLLTAGTNITLSYNDSANTLTINSSGGAGGGIPEAPTDGQTYGRRGADATWQLVTGGGGGIAEAPNDGGLYGRQALSWQKAVKVSGDTLTGFLSVHAQPTSNLHVANKAYVDTNFASVSYVNSQVALSVLKGGSTMTGLLVLSADPSANLGAATKQYVDNANTAQNTVINGKLSDAPVDGKQYARKDALWSEVAAPAGGGARTVLAVATTFYVATTGNDTTGDGLTAGTAFATLQKAWDNLCDKYDCAGQATTIQLSAGVYTSGLSAKKAPLNADASTGVIIRGQATITDVHLNMPTSTNGFFFRRDHFVTVRDMQITTFSNSSAFRIIGSTLVTTNVTYNGAGKFLDAVGEGCSCTLQTGSNINSASLTTAISAGENAFVFMQSGMVLTGTPAFTQQFANIMSGATLVIGALPTGAGTGKRYTITYGARIIFMTAWSTASLPGDVVGTVDANGSVYGTFAAPPSLISMSDTAPASPTAGQLWCDTTTMSLYVHYYDGNTSQWVQLAGT